MTKDSEYKYSGILFLSKLRVTHVSFRRRNRGL